MYIYIYTHGIIISGYIHSACMSIYIGHRIYTMYTFIVSMLFGRFEVAVLNAWWRHPEGLRAWSS